MGKGFSGMPGNIQGMMQQAQKMQQEIAKAQERAEHFEEEGTAGGGMVKVVANGKNEILSMKIAKDVVDPDDIDMLEDLAVAACNEALGKVKAKVESELSKATGGMSLPNLF